MSDPTTIAASENKARGIILVEPYDALGVAISSALRKFASLHEVRVAVDLALAETVAGSLQPELFVLDLDPPPGDTVAFFTRLRAHYPEARALVIAASSGRELRALRGPGGALQFIEKPFDLGAFGAAVQALLGPWAASPAADARGTLRDLHVIDLVQLKCLARSSGRLRVQGAHASGDIFFQDGEICHASAGALHGAAAFDEMISWFGDQFSEHELPEDFQRTIDRPWQILLLDALEKAENKSAGSLGKKEQAAEPSPETGSLGSSRGESQPPENGAPSARHKRILVIDDTEMLLIFVSDVLRTADHTCDVVTARSGEEGLRLARAEPPDLILLDYSLSDINGKEVCRALLAEETTARIPVLMMSGHLPEMADAAAAFGNIVETLPKPFLSGALINAVAKIFDVGLSPKMPASPPAAKTAEPPVQGVQPGTTVPPAAASPNGHASHENDDFSATPDTPTALLSIAPPHRGALPPTRQTPFQSPGAILAQHRQVILTLACDVLAVQLAPDLRMGALQLKPAETAVLLRMSGVGETTAIYPKKDFRLGAVELNQAGQISTLRLISAAPVEHPAANGGDFAVDQVNAEADGTEQLVELTGARGGAVMRVKLIADFTLLRVELSDDFVVAAVVLEARGDRVQIQTGENRALAMQFYLHQVQLNGSGGISSLSVSSRR